MRYIKEIDRTIKTEVLVMEEGQPDLRRQWLRQKWSRYAFDRTGTDVRRNGDHRLGGPLHDLL